MEDQKLLQEIKKEILGVEDRLGARIDDVLEAMGIFSNEVDKRFMKIEKTMVTKDYLHDEFLDLRSDLTVLARRQNKKLSTVIETLVDEGSLTRKAAKRLLALEPFSA